jgi:hypothetical protein
MLTDDQLLLLFTPFVSAKPPPPHPELKEKKKHIKEFILITRKKVTLKEFTNMPIEDFLKN